MSLPSHSRDERDSAVHRALRELPVRQAPRSLELRVLAEIERRCALPWWRRSFAFWPLAARVIFFVVCAAIVKLAFMAGVWGMSGFEAAHFKTAFAEPIAWMNNGLLVVRAIFDAFDLLLRTLPAVWLYGGLVFFATVYAALFGLGAAALKALRAHD